MQWVEQKKLQESLYPVFLNQDLTNLIFYAIIIKLIPDGEVSERFKEPVLKTGDAAMHRGFESHSLRHISAKTEKYSRG